MKKLFFKNKRESLEILHKDLLADDQLTLREFIRETKIQDEVQDREKQRQDEIIVEQTKLHIIAGDTREVINNINENPTLSSEALQKLLICAASLGRKAIVKELLLLNPELTKEQTHELVEASEGYRLSFDLLDIIESEPEPLSRNTVTRKSWVQKITAAPDDTKEKCMMM